MPKGIKGFQKGHKGYKGQLGKKFSEEHRKKLSRIMKKQYQEGKRKGFQKGHTVGMTDKKHSEEAKRKISLGNKGKIVSEETRKKMSEVCQGKKHSELTKIKMRKNSYMKGKLGKDSPNWKGGVIKNQRNDPAYHLWVKAVRKRDNNTCWINDENCLGYNIVHHIKGWSEYPKLRYELTNGITLCQAHHPRTKAKEKLFERLFSYLVVQK